MFAGAQGATAPAALKVQRERFLRLTGLTAGGFLSLTAFQAEGCGIALRAMLIKSALQDLLSVSYGKITFC